MKDLIETVAFIEENFRNGNWIFFTETEFGILGVESKTEDYKPMYPVIVAPWEQEQDSNFWYDHRRTDADMYVGIGNSHFAGWARHVHVIEAVCRAFFMSTLGIDPGEPVIDAAVDMYLSRVEGRGKTPTKMIDEFLRTNFDIVVRNMPSSKMMAEKIVTMRINACDDVEYTAERLVNEYENRAGYGMMEFCIQNLWMRGLFSLVLYCIQKNPKLHVNIVRERQFGVVVVEECKIHPVDGIII